jgi:hypothetical protein
MQADAEHQRSRRRELIGKSIATAVFCAFIILLHFRHSQTTGKVIDFTAFYTAAHMVKDGAGHQLFDFSLQQQYQSQLLGGWSGLVFYNPPAAALLYLPVAFFNFGTAYILWATFCVSLLLWSAKLLHDVIGVGKDVFQIIPLIFVFFPVHIHLLQGQIDLVLLPILLLTLRALQQERHARAGLLLAIGLLKFQFVLPLVAIQLLRRQWRFLFGFTAGAAAFACVCIAVTGLQEFVHYLRLLTHVSSMPEIGVHPAMMANIRGLLFAIFQHDLPWLTLLFSVALIGWSVYAWKSLESGFANALIVTLLVSYHFNPHSMALLILPLAVAMKNIEWRLSARVFAIILLGTPLLLIPLMQRQKVAFMAVPIAALLFIALGPIKMHKIPNATESGG